jgi:hypothetical protein
MVGRTSVMFTLARLTGRGFYPDHPWGATNKPPGRGRAAGRAPGADRAGNAGRDGDDDPGGNQMEDPTMADGGPKKVVVYSAPG